MEFFFGIILGVVIVAINVATRQKQRMDQQRAQQMLQQEKIARAETQGGQKAVEQQQRVHARLEHRLKLPGEGETAGARHVHPAQQNTAETETWVPKGSLDITYAGEGCEMPRPIAVQKGKTTNCGKAFRPFTHTELQRSIIVAEAVMQRGGRALRGKK